MNTTHALRQVLEDYPPLDKPTRLPLRQGWRTAGVLRELPDLARLSDPRRFLVLAQPDRGEIRAACEHTLAQGRAALAHAVEPGALLAFDAVRAHRYLDARSGREMEALMFVRVEAPRARWEPLARDLRARGARLHEVEMQAHCVVLRAQLLLGRLLGFACHAKAAGARVATWLVRYEPVGSPAGRARPAAAPGPG